MLVTGDSVCLYRWTWVFGIRKVILLISFFLLKPISVSFFSCSLGPSQNTHGFAKFSCFPGLICIFWFLLILRTRKITGRVWVSNLDTKVNYCSCPKKLPSFFFFFLPTEIFLRGTRPKQSKPKNKHYTKRPNKHANYTLQNYGP